MNVKVKTEASNTVRIFAHGVELEGKLVLPDICNKIVIFSHGSGSSRFSPRNNYVARILHDEKIGTFLIDLLTKEEDEVYENRFNIDLLSERLIKITEWVTEQGQMMNFNIGYFGASTGAASAMRAAAKLGSLIKAIVSRGGRPDLAMEVLDKVNASTLLIVGSLDHQVIELNQLAYRKLKSEKRLLIIPGAGHLFEEPGTLKQVADFAALWYKEKL